jgi:hypothetical protein
LKQQQHQIGYKIQENKHNPDNGGSLSYYKSNPKMILDSIDVCNPEYRELEPRYHRSLKEGVSRKEFIERTVTKNRPLPNPVHDKRVRKVQNVSDYDLEKSLSDLVINDDPH